MTLDQLTVFFGWMAVVNIVLLLFMTLWLMLFRGWSKSIHSSMFAVPADALDVIYFRYIAAFKILTIIFSITPWIALKLMA